MRVRFADSAGELFHRFAMRFMYNDIMYDIKRAG